MTSRPELLVTSLLLACFLLLMQFSIHRLGWPVSGDPVRLRLTPNRG
jgi:hypothetical protein